MNEGCKRKKRSSSAHGLGKPSFRESILTSGAVEASLSCCLDQPHSPSALAALDEFVKASLPSDPASASALVTAVQQLARALQDEPDPELLAAARGSMRSAVRALKGRNLDAVGAPQPPHQQRQQEPEQVHTELNNGLNWRALADRLRVVLTPDDEPYEHPSRFRCLANERLAGAQKLEGTEEEDPTSRTDSGNRASNAPDDNSVVFASSDHRSSDNVKVQDGNRSHTVDEADNRTNERRRAAAMRKEQWQEYDNHLAQGEYDKIAEKQRLEHEAANYRQRAEELRRELEHVEAQASQKESQVNDLQQRLKELSTSRQGSKEEIENATRELQSLGSKDTCEDRAESTNATKNNSPNATASEEEVAKKQAISASSHAEKQPPVHSDRNVSWGSSLNDEQTVITHTGASEEMCNANDSVPYSSSAVEALWLQLEGAKEVERVLEGAENSDDTALPSVQELVASVEDSVRSAVFQLRSITSRASTVATEQQGNEQHQRVPASQGKESMRNELESLIVMAKRTANEALAAREPLQEFASRIAKECGRSRYDEVVKALNRIEEATLPLEDGSKSSEQRAIEFVRRFDTVTNAL